MTPLVFPARALALCLSASFVCALCSAATVEQRLEQLEAELKTLQSENAQLRHDLGADHRDGPARIQPAGTESMLTAGGFVQMQADALDKGDPRFTSSHDRFYLRRARLYIAGKFRERMDFRLPPHQSRRPS